MKYRFPAWIRVIAKSITDWWDGWTDHVLIGTLWILAQFTVILGPPATFGAYYVAHEQINGQGLSLPGMIQGARKYFGVSLLWGLMNIVVLGLIWISYDFYGSIQATFGIFLQAFVFVLGVLWVLTQFYTLPYYFMMDPPSLRTAMRNGILTVMASPFFAIAMGIIMVIDLVLSIGLVLPAFLALPVIIPYLGFRALQNRLETFGLRKPEKTPQEIEAEMGGKISTENINPIGRRDSVGEDNRTSRGKKRD